MGAIGQPQTAPSAPVVTKVNPQPAAGAPAPAKEAKVKVPKPPRKTLWGRLKDKFRENASLEAILAMVKEEFPTSDFNGNAAFHYRYYRGKYNMEARQAGTAETTSPTWPKPIKEPKPAKVAAAPAGAIAGGVKTIAQPAGKAA